MKNCISCGYTLNENANFCSNCGTEVSLKDKLTGYASRLKFKAINSIENFRNSIDLQISQFLEDVNNKQEAKIAGIRVPESRQTAVSNALQSFQDKYLDGSPANSEEYDTWLENLPQRLDDHNCIVCFSQWDVKDNDIVVCPNCNTGGHQSHIENWIKTKNYCPLCRTEVRFSEFIRIVE